MQVQKRFLPVVAGHAIECFDITLYGFFAVQLAPIFFPTSDSFSQLMNSFGAFAAGFFARPLGALFFGYWGDKIGRRTPLMLSMVLVAIPTLIIGCLPSYQTIGALCPLILFGCRLAQGFFYGGELAGSSLTVMENSNGQQVATKVSFLVSGGVMGAILATIFGIIVNMDGMPEWSWRIPFWFGGTSALLIYVARRSLPETIAFEESKKIPYEFPWRILLKTYKKVLIFGFVLCGLTLMPLYLTTIFGNAIFKSLGYSSMQSMVLNMVVMVFVSLLVLSAGRWADRFGFYRFLMFSLLSTAIVAVPSFSLINGTAIPSTKVFVFLFLINFFGTLINGCATAYVGSLLPVRCRYTGLSMCLTGGAALFGGTVPYIAQYLQKRFDSQLAPGFYLMIMALIGALLLTYVHRTHSPIRKTLP